MTIKTYLKCSIYISNFIAFETTYKVFVSETNVEKGYFIISTKRNKKMQYFNFKATIAQGGYHLYIEIAWSGANVNDKFKIEIETNQSSFAIDLYACAIKAKQKYFDGWKAVGQVPREILGYIYFFIKKEGGKISGNMKSFNY